ncbi:MAG: hypothetical protein RI883_99 [Bacteroidota bacterium]
MIRTADEASYFAPPLNYLEKGVWSDNSDGITRFYQRPPGYGTIFLILKFTLGKYALLGLKGTQIIGFFFSILLLGKICIKLLSSEKTTITITLVFALLPMYSGFMYYTLTEGITPFLILYSLYSFFKIDSNKKPYGIIFSNAFLILVRPQLILLPLLFLLYFFIKKEKKQSLLILIAFLPFLLWQIRTFSISNEIPSLHPIYSKYNKTLFRPSHEKMTKLFRIWESDGEQFHSAISSIKNSNINDALSKIPTQLQSTVEPVLKAYEKLLNSEYTLNSTNFQHQENNFSALINQTTIQLKKENTFLNHIKTPLKSAYYLLSKSQMNLYIFQETFRGNFFVELLRIISVVLINLGFLSAFLILIRFKLDYLTIISSFILLSFFYLIYFQRLNEERYLTPLLPLLLICFFYEISRLKIVFQRYIF